MKFLIFTCFLMFSLNNYGQSVIADPAINQVDVANIDHTVLNASSIPLDNALELKIPIYNYDLVNGLPQGSCKIKIGLGSKMILDPQFNLSSLPSSAYFNWTFDTGSGQGQITGDLKKDLPPNYSDNVILKLIGNLQGNSTITTNFLVTNHNTAIVLSDLNPTNNNSFLAYTIVPAGPLPVTFTGLNVVNKGCVIDVDFFTQGEINVNKYEIEVSKDGVNFINTGVITAANLSKYSYSFSIKDAFKAPQVFVRIKSLDKDGKFQYSGTKSVKGECQNDWAVGVYPNPAKSVSRIVLIAKQGQFNGKYGITLADMAGKILLVKEMNLINATQFYLETGNVSAGQYIIKISNIKDGQSSILKWQKY